MGTDNHPNASRMPLPQSPEAVTPEWLSSALSVKHPNVKVRDLVISEVVQSTATKLKLEVSYDDNGADLPSSMWLKAGFRTSHQES